MFTLAIFVQVN